MRSIKKPEFGVKAVLIEATSNMRNKLEMERFRSNSDEMERDEKLYSEYAHQHALYKMPEKYETEQHMPVEDMVKLFDNHLLVKKNPARKYYDKLKSSVEKCPYCQARDIDDLDHFLPKTKFATLTIIPSNLIPICHSCNRIKLSYSPYKSEQVLWHPYFDNYSGRWLHAELIHHETPYFRFYVEFKDSELAPEYEKRQMNAIEFTFNKLKLDKAYRYQSLSFFMGFNLMAVKLYRENGKECVKKHIIACAKSFFNADKNSLEVAMLESMGNDDWYFDTYLKYTFKEKYGI